MSDGDHCAPWSRDRTHEALVDLHCVARGVASPRATGCIVTKDRRGRPCLCKRCIDLTLGIDRLVHALR